MRRALAAVAVLMAVGCAAPTVEPGTGPAMSEPSEAPASSPSVTDNTASFSEQIVYPDGVAVEVTRIRKVKLSDSGLGDKGQKTGDPFWLLSIRVTNGSKTPLDVYPSSVMTYGPDGVEAPMVWDSSTGTQDIEGKVLPGKAKTGGYGWVVPAKYTNDVVLEFTLDAEHGAAIFTGGLS